MVDHAGDATTQEQRSTNQGRVFGSVSYAADEQFSAEDLRARPSLSTHQEVTDEHWTQRPSRSTGARRRIL